jgi:UDP-3-O-[3-hydroxymyristoyl] glucosamine N-acyltransferase
MTADDIAALVGGRVIGDGATVITGVNGIRESGPGDLTFVRDGKYLALLQDSMASAVLIAREAPECGQAQILVGAPDLAFAQVLQRFHEESLQHPQGIHASAVIATSATLGTGVAADAHVRIADGAVIGDGAILYAGVYVGRNARVGANTILFPNAVLREQCELGARCIVHANVSIGSDGFGFAPLGGQWMKIPQVGRVVIGDDVEIGSNTAIDRATFGVTCIGNGVKIDNLVQIGHNVQIGEHTVIAGKVGIAGSAILGKHVRVGAYAGINGHIEIGDGATIGALAGVTRSIAPGQTVSGFPAIDHLVQRRVMVVQTQLPDLLRRVRQLERELQQMKEDVHDKAKDDRK